MREIKLTILNTRYTLHARRKNSGSLEGIFFSSIFLKLPYHIMSAIGTYLGQVGLSASDKTILEAIRDKTITLTRPAPTKGTLWDADNIALNGTSATLDPATNGRHVCIFGSMVSASDPHTRTVTFDVEYGNDADEWFPSGNKITLTAKNATPANFSMEFATSASKMRLRCSSLEAVTGNINTNFFYSQTV